MTNFILNVIIVGLLIWAGAQMLPLWGAVVAGFSVGIGIIIARNRTRDAVTQPSESAEKANAQDDNSVADELKDALSAMQSENFSRCIELARPYLDDPSGRIRDDANLMSGISHGRLQQFPEALACFKASSEHEIDASRLFNIATILAMMGDADQAEEYLRRSELQRGIEHSAEKPELGEGIRIRDGLKVAHFAQCLSDGGRADRAVGFLADLGKIYSSLKITDPNYLHMRSMPFFSDFLCKSLPILQKVMDEDEIRDWFKPVHEAVDEDGKALFAEHHIPH